MGSMTPSLFSEMVGQALLWRNLVYLVRSLILVKAAAQTILTFLGAAKVGAVSRVSIGADYVLAFGMS